MSNKQDAAPSGGLTRRELLGSSAALLIGASAPGAAQALTFRDTPEWKPLANVAVEPVDENAGWQFFTEEEAATVEAIVERLIPADALSMSGKEAGCTVFIDRQLAGAYGDSERLYMHGPFQEGTPEQGDQSPLTPQQRYRIGLSALDDHCRNEHGAAFAELADEQRDQVLTQLEENEIALGDIDSQVFFEIVLQNTMEGFFADPLYGGNRDMVSWKMLGFPGARYDYRDYVERHNEDLGLEPVSIGGRPDWQAQG
ncbi:gluconate 2-dehydrogenase subunit 3 family protein [Halomonas dongshanensis]|uniref:Gluconate 2-dehydrogenase subunit 3 family protein n=1 Tax=Halomonas dongshanensis TaxID=2890835 RepID=A0ABT2EA39_9GAMM|nr:gluconate 2-dehydrogenase subunit 3 family protein [Halomonas dongshanensis]MCS2608223.1 gluconate 2-dehydrogenase subunit 3 family protein [Halomonas dongshanensis]